MQGVFEAMKAVQGMRKSFCVPTVAALAPFAVIASLAGPASAGSIDPFYAEVLAAPDDPAVNLAYAKRAEDRGELRKALATYERILAAHPDNTEASAGLLRMRRALVPDMTLFRAEIGGGYQSNARQSPSPFETGQGTAFASFSVRDARKIGRYRWRTEFGISSEVFGDTTELNQAALFGAIGPVVPLVKTITVRPALVGAYTFLDGNSFYGEVGGSLTFEGTYAGAMQSIEVRTTWRDYASRWSSDSGVVVDVRGHFTQPDLFAEGDAITVRPRFRWSDVDASSAVRLVTNLEPGRYTEVGAKFGYFYPLTEWLIAGPSFEVSRRWFATPGLFGGTDRADTFYAPGASAVVHDVIAQNVDLRFDYQYQKQDSNDPTRDFDNHAVSARIQARF